MRLHPELDVTFNYQNFGSTWAGVLRGATENVRLSFNSLFNYCATNGELEFHDHLETVAVFWTSRRAMRRYFFNRYYMPRCMGNRGKGQGRLARMAMRYAWEQLAKMSQCHEAFFDFSGEDNLQTYGNGTISAERPDSDMKDAILAHAFQEKETITHKVIDND